jgi:PAS domain S-box-containing protein
MARRLRGLGQVLGRFWPGRPDPLPHTGDAPARRVINLFAGAIVAIAALTIASHAVIQPALEGQKEYGRLIDIAGRQRMLSQQLSQAALTMQLAGDEASFRARTAALKEALSSWTSIHRRLVQGDPELLPPEGDGDARIARRIDDLEADFHAMESAARQVLAQAAEKPWPAIDRGRLYAAAEPLLDHQAGYLSGMDEIVALYRGQAKSQLLRIQRTELALVGAILFLLVFTGLSVLRPAARTMRRQFAQLTESEERFRLMADTAPVMIWMSGPDKACHYFNQGWLDFTGRTLEQELGYGWVDAVHPEDVERCVATYENAFGKRRPFRMEYRMARRDGEYRWVLDAGTPRTAGDWTFSGYIGSCVDITDHRRAEQALRQAHDELEERVRQRTANLVQANAQLEEEIAERQRVQQQLMTQQSTLRAVLDNAPIGIWMVGIDGKLHFYNEAFRSWFGLTDAPVQEGVAPDPGLDTHGLGSWWLGDEVPGLEGSGPWHSRERVRFADGGSHDLEIIRAPILELSGRPIGWVGLGLDVTERELAEMAAREHQAMLAHFSRLSTVGELASGIAHELNQPLAAICNYARGCVRRLEGDGQAPEEVLDAMRRVAAQGERAGQVLRRIRNFLRKEAPPPVPVDVNRVIREAAELIAPELQQKAISLRLDLVSTPPVMADFIQIEQVVLNLAQNAVEAMHGERRELAVETRVGADVVEVAVLDTGPGLGPEALDRVFDPFYSTKPNGMGMGLSISRSIIEAHHGRLWAADRDGGGAAFRFTLPLAQPSAHGQDPGLAPLGENPDGPTGRSQ